MGQPLGPPPFAWHDADALAGLLGPHSFTIDVEEFALSFAAPSASSYLDGEFANHPLWLSGRAILGPAETGRLRTRVLDILEERNEVSDGFRITSRYVVATARRGG